MATTDDDAIIVVGSGPCGAIATSRLVEHGHKVVLLDAGLAAPAGLVVRAAGNTLLRRMGGGCSTDRLSRASAPGVDWYSSLSLGGLSNYWTAAVPRFAPADFTDGARLDDRYRWPVSYDELVPFYAVAEQALAVTGGEDIPGLPSNVTRYDYRPPADWRALVDAANARGHAVGVLPMAKGRPWMVARRGTEFNSYHCMLVPLAGAPRFRMQTGAHVVRLNWDGRAGLVTGVHYVDRRTRELVELRGRAVVVAAGAIDSTALLLRSTSSDFPDGLGNAAGQLGRYLHDHPREWWPATSAVAMRALSHPIYVARRGHDNSTPLMATSMTIGLARRIDRLRTYWHGGRASTVGVQVFGTMVPSEDVGVTLDRSACDDPSGSRPRIDLHYDSATVANLVEARERLRDVFGAGGIALDIPGPFHELRPGSSVHFGGSARMHADPRFGVLDAWNRVHDATNVVVCDSSCFTTGPEKNPTLTAMAIAARAADRLAGDVDGRS